jgi:hypothetical protein
MLEGALTLVDIEAHVRALASRVGLRETHLPTFGHSEDGARPHIEVNGLAYHYVVVERGRELDRRTFFDEGELLFCIFEGATSELAGSLELASRRSERVDFRRERFRIHVELMGQVSEHWAARVAAAYSEVLRKHPFTDVTEL